MINKYPPTMEDLVKVMSWRNKVPEALRTSRLTTIEMQERFYKRLQEDAYNFYFSFFKENCINPIGFSGITNISWENSNGEISLIVNPTFTKKGFGSAILEQMLDYGFNYLNLVNIYGECYRCNPNLGFWDKICKKYKAYKTDLPERKFWDGKYYSSMYFNIENSEFRGALRNEKNTK